MTKHLSTALLIVALVGVGVLACSPGMVLQGLVGDTGTRAVDTPVSVAQGPTSIPPLGSTPPGSMAATALAVSTTLPTEPSTTPAATLTGPSAPAIVTSPPATSTSTPLPVLPLRDDLPPLALRDFPRPANDNGRCMHFLPTGYYTQRDFEVQIPRLQGLQARWVLALYADENQLKLAAAQFKKAGIIPVWRKTLRAFQRYYAWDRDIKILQDAGLPPYFQLYNEPDMGEEWEGRDINRDQWVAAFVQTAKDVYNAGGLVGIQVLDEEWLRAALRMIKAQKGERLFTRMFFVPHPYGVNHPPNYVEDEVGVLGYRLFADVFQQEIGFIPPFIAGEGGWKFNATEDNRFPVVDDKLHAKYHVELFRWFLDGKVSDGQPLPDYLFAFCPWLLAGQLEGGAWYDSFEGNRELTISEVKKIPIFTRRFSWDKQ